MEYTALVATSREQVFTETEQRWAEGFWELNEVLREIEATNAEIEKLKSEYSDYLPHGGRSRSTVVEEIEAALRLTMPEEVNGKKLSNEESRKAWLTVELAKDPNYIAAKTQQAEAEEGVASLYNKLEVLKARLVVGQTLCAHQDATLGFFRKA